VLHRAVEHHEGSTGAAYSKAQQQQQQQQQQQPAGAPLLARDILEDLRYLMSRPFFVDPDRQPDNSCLGSQTQHQCMPAHSSSFRHGTSSSNSGYAGPSSSSFHQGASSSSGYLGLAAAAAVPACMVGPAAAVSTQAQAAAAGFNMAQAAAAAALTLASAAAQLLPRFSAASASNCMQRIRWWQHTSLLKRFVHPAALAAAATCTVRTA
jgi:hypothetical protein